MMKIMRRDMDRCSLLRRLLILAPDPKRLHRIRKDCKEPFQPIHVPFGAPNIESKSVHVFWPCADVPELRHILCRQTELMSFPMKCL